MWTSRPLVVADGKNEVLHSLSVVSERNAMSPKRRQSPQKREREQKKRERQRKKTEQVLEKRERCSSPTQQDDLPGHKGVDPAPDQDCTQADPDS